MPLRSKCALFCFRVYVGNLFCHIWMAKESQWFWLPQREKSEENRGEVNKRERMIFDTVRANKSRYLFSSAIKINCSEGQDALQVYWFLLDKNIFLPNQISFGQLNEVSVRIVTGIHREDRWNFGDQRMDVHKELRTLPVD